MIGAWAKLLWNSAAVAAIAAAAQLGVADALGIIRWGSDASTRDWAALLTWIAFCYAVAVLGGALVGRMAVRRGDRRDGVGARIMASFAATVGAAAVIGLAWLPASGAQPPANVNPGLVVSITAGAGVVAGFLFALLALSARPVAIGLKATVAWLWLAAIGSSVAGLVTHQPYPSPRLGVVDAPQLAGSFWTSPQVMVGVSAVLGIVVAGLARWRRSGRFGVALAGFAGPAMVGAAYLIAGPGTSSDRTAQAQPYLAALIAVGAGLIASVLIAMPGRRVPLPPRHDLSLDDLRPLAGDVVTRPGGRGLPDRPSFGEKISDRDGRGGDESTYPGGLGEPWASEPYAATFSAAERESGWQSDRQPDRQSGSGWDSDTWPGSRAGRLAGRLGDAREGEPEPGSGSGSTYRGGAYSSSAPESPSVTGTIPMMGQPTDAHESWLRDLGPSGRHGFDERP